MRTRTAAMALGFALLAHQADAQIMQRPTPVPTVVAGGTGWYQSGEPIFYAGAYYYQTGPSVFFDGNVMARTGIYQGIPLYEDSTIIPFSIVYVPVSGKVMRPYERRRDGDLAGTTASRTPSFPVQNASDPYQGRDIFAGSPTPVADRDSAVVPDLPRAVGSMGSALPSPVATTARTAPAAASKTVAARTPAQPPRLESWVMYQGIRWYASGQATPFDSQRFVSVGTYEGSPVYRARQDESAIFIAMVEGGFLTPFSRR